MSNSHASHGAPHVAANAAMSESAAAVHRRDDDAVDVKKTRIALDEPKIVGAVVGRAFAEREQERGDLAAGIDDPVIRSAAMQRLEPLGAERAQKVHGFVVERENLGEIFRQGIPDHHRRLLDTRSR
jgi:hypothetical protein